MSSSHIERKTEEERKQALPWRDFELPKSAMCCPVREHPPGHGRAQAKIQEITTHMWTPTGRMTV